MAEDFTLVLGVGNELYRDEGVGVIVARLLARQTLPPGVRVVEGAVGGLDLLFEMEGAERVILLDAVDMGQPPGTVRVFTPEEVELELPGTVASLHQIDLAQVLALGQLVGVVPRVHIVGLQPGAVSPGFALTAAVSAAVPRAVRETRRLLAVAGYEVDPDEPVSWPEDEQMGSGECPPRPCCENA